jgi:exonuclease VII small subunit
VKGLASIVVGGAVVLTAAAPAFAQSVAAAAKADAELKQQRYQIGQMERLLEGAVEHGLNMVKDRLQTVAQMPADLLVSDNAHARGFRLEGYGVFFDISVPTFNASITWSLRTLDQNDLGLESALKALQKVVKNTGDADLEQAYKRVELQVNPGVLTRSTAPAPAASGARMVTGSAAAAQDVPAPAQASTPDPILTDPNEVYRAEVTQALMDAMLDHSSSLSIAPGEWLIIAAKGNDDRPRLGPADSDSRTRIIRLRGSDLSAYLARQISREEALQRIEVKVF